MPSADCYTEGSWAETLQGYAANRNAMPWAAADVRPAHQIAKNNQNHPASRVSAGSERLGSGLVT
jgi:hypothetical protein